MVKQTPEEIRQEVREADNKKDISIYIAVPVGVVAGLSAMGAVCAVIIMRALVYFREGVDFHWMSCVPFIFPCITGLFAAYKKQFSLLGVHLSVILLALLMGGFGFGMSVDPIFISRDRCVQTHRDMTCDRKALSYLYLVSGSVAAGFTVIGLLLTICALRSATRRIAKRREEEELRHLREQEAKLKELRHLKSHDDVLKNRTVSMSSAHSGATQNPPAPAANGDPTAQCQVNAAAAPTPEKSTPPVEEKTMTKL